MNNNENNIYINPTNVYMKFINCFSYHLVLNLNYDQDLDKKEIFELGNNIWL